MPRQTFPRDRFDDVTERGGRVGAHRAENPRLRVGAVLLWAIVATILLVVLGVFGSLVASGRIVLFPAAAESAAPTPVITPVIDTSYTVLVLNATTETGLATQVKASLLLRGWSEQTVNAGNAGSAFDTTTVYYASEDAYAAALGLADLVGASRVQYDPDYPLPDTSATQLTAVLGTDQLPETTPAP